MGNPRDASSPRAAPNDALDHVLDLLTDIKTRIDQHTPTGKPGSGMLEKYDYFCRVSDKGRACTYGMKAKQLFLLCDFKDVKELLEKAVFYMRQIPGHENFGK